MPFVLLDKKVSIGFQYLLNCTTCRLDIYLFKSWKTGFECVEIRRLMHGISSGTAPIIQATGVNSAKMEIQPVQMQV
jgi:hypothetical protein